MEAEQTSPWEETSSRQCALLWALHKVPPHLADHLAQHGKTSAEDVENWDTGSPSAETAIKEHRTRDIPTREKGENPRRLVKLELMTTTVTWWVLQLSCKHHLTVEPMTTTVTRWCCNCPASTISQ